MSKGRLKIQITTSHRKSGIEGHFKQACVFKSPYTD